MLLLSFCLMAATSTLSSGITVVNPLNQQLPPIARVNQPYSWSPASDTFALPGGIFNLEASSLPPWLSFDSSAFHLYGTPTAKDEGNPKITITAQDDSSSVSSSFTMCVTSFPAPTLNLPIGAQLYASNPSLSSVFLVAPNSALATPNPALRIPPRWSFSIGFQGNTFVSANSLYYDALQANGSALPDWIVFNPATITLNGFVPEEYSTLAPQTIPLALHASDQQGYTATSLPFDIVIAERELSVNTSLPTINITASTPFNLSLTSPDDFSGVYVDNDPIQSADIASLAIDVSQYGSWLKYDQANRMLMGEPPSDLHNSGQSLPVTLTSVFNQTVHTNVSLAVVPSYFCSPNLAPISVGEDGHLNFNLRQYFSNATVGQQHDSVDLTASFSPKESSNYLGFDSATAQLTGKNLPSDSISGYTRVMVTFTAYSHATHSTSHATLAISLVSSDYRKKRNGRPHLSDLSDSAHRKLVLGLAIMFSIMGGIVVVGTILSAFRRCARVDDTAVGGEAGRNAWSANDRKWYGIDTENREGDQERGYGWSEKSPTGRNAMEIDNPFVAGLAMPFPTRAGHKNYGGLGSNLQRVSARISSNQSQHSQALSPRSAVMSKAEFLGKIKETVRNVSDRYKRTRAGPRRPVIGKPVLITPAGGILNARSETFPFDNASALESPSNPGDGFDDGDIRNYAASYITDSPSSSTGSKSIPRRRADFAPPGSPIGPREPALVQLKDSQSLHTGMHHGRQSSGSSTDSLDSDSSAKTHAAEAVVQTAARATSVRSVRSTAEYLVPPVVGGAPPRLVPFTSSTRVPVPRASSASFPEDAANLQNKRVASQSATVFKGGSTTDGEKGSVDDLRVGMHYVRTLGGDEHTTTESTTESNSAIFYANPSTPTISTNLRSSFSSLESSHHGHGSVRDGEGNIVSRMLIRAGEKFKFRVPTSIDSPSYKRGQLDVRLISGHALPKFLEANVKGSGRHKGTVEFVGTPTVRDIGEISLGVYTREHGECVARVIIEVVGRS